MLRNPDLALTLYLAIIIVGFMFGSRWAGLRAALATAGQAGSTKAATK